MRVWLWRRNMPPLVFLLTQKGGKRWGESGTFYQEFDRVGVGTGATSAINDCYCGFEVQWPFS